MSYVTVPAPAAGTGLAFDLISGAYFARSKMTFGVEGVAVDVSATNPLPIGGSVGVTGSVAVTGTFWPATQPVSGPLTDGQLRASAVPVSLASQPLPTNAATDATLVQIRDLMAAASPVAGLIMFDSVPSPPVYYIRREKTSSTGVLTVSWTDLSGNAVTPSAAVVARLQSAANAANVTTENVFFTATAPGTGYAVNDLLVHAIGFDVDSGTIAYNVWINTAGGTVITAPTAANVSPMGGQTLDVQAIMYKATAAGTGYAAGDYLIRSIGSNAATATPTQAFAYWLNFSTGAYLAAAPTPGSYDLPPQPTTVGGVVDTVVRSAAVDRGTIIGFTGATFTTSAGSNAVTLVVAPTSGSVVLGQQVVVTGAGFAAGTTLATLVSGTLGAAGSTYTMSANATSAVTGAAATSVGPQQLMGANPTRRGVVYQNQHSTAKVWVNGLGAATADYHSLIIPPANAEWESPAHHVGTGAIAAIADTPATPLYAREF